MDKLEKVASSSDWCKACTCKWSPNPVTQLDYHILFLPGGFDGWRRYKLMDRIGCLNEPILRAPLCGANNPLLIWGLIWNAHWRKAQNGVGLFAHCSIIHYPAQPPNALRHLGLDMTLWLITYISDKVSSFTIPMTVVFVNMRWPCGFHLQLPIKF